jgi:hypothetical protein
MFTTKLEEIFTHYLLKRPKNRTSNAEEEFITTLPRYGGGAAREKLFSTIVFVSEIFDKTKLF